MTKSNQNDEDASEGEAAASRPIPRRGVQRLQAASRSSKARRRAGTVSGIHQRTNKRAAW